MARIAKTQALTEIDEIREALISTMRTLRMVPRSYFDKPGRVRSQWPEFNRGSGLSDISERRPMRTKATPQQISDMEYWLDLSLVLEDECRRIVMARACRIPWRRLEEMDGRSHTTLRKIERRGLEVLARHDARQQNEYAARNGGMRIWG